MLDYPLRRDLLAWLCGLSLAALLPLALTGVMELQFVPEFRLYGSPSSVFSVLLGLALEAVLAMMALRLAVEGLLGAASGRGEDQDRHQLVSDGQAFRQMLFWAGLLVALYLTGRVGGRATLVIALLALFLVLPAMLSLLVMEDSLTRALNPLAWFEMLRRSGPPYLALAAKLALLAVAAVAFDLLLPASIPSWLGTPVTRFVLLYALFAGYRGLGQLLDSQREDFELAREPELARPTLASMDEDAAMREADALLAEDKPGEAAARLAPLIRGQGASAPVHARYRELLGRAGDRDGLLQHGHDYIAVQLALGQERPALSLYLACVQLEPGFQMAEPEEVSRLIAVAARGGQAQLAVKLAEEFGRRFPRDRDRVLNGLTAARLMATRLDRADEARQLLQGLLQSHPDHALAPELEKALQEIPAQPRT